MFLDPVVSSAPSTWSSFFYADRQCPPAVFFTPMRCAPKKYIKSWRLGFGTSESSALTLFQSVKWLGFHVFRFVVGLVVGLPLFRLLVSLVVSQSQVGSGMIHAVRLP